MNLSLNAYTASSMMLGYGAAAVNILKSLADLDIKIAWTPIGNPHLTIPIHSEVQQWINNQDSFDPNAPSILVWHENQLMLRPGKGECFALSFWELDTFNDRRIHHLNSVDHIICPTTWAKTILDKNNIKTPSTIIPLGVDTNLFQPSPAQKKDDTFRFLVMGKFELRKNHHHLPEIFNTAFTPDDNVEFWLSCNNVFITPEEDLEWKNYFLSTKLGDKIKFLPQVPTDIELAKIMQSCDCGISISSAEGFDMPLFYMMACGLQIICTNCTGHTEYCTLENSYLIDCKNLEWAMDSRWFGVSDNKGYWHKFDQPQINQCVDYMRAAYKKGPTLNREGVKTAQKLTWNHCAQKIKSLIFPEK